MPARAHAARLARVAALVALAPFLAGAHCNEDCGPPAVRLVGGRNLERTLYGPGVLALRPRVAPLAGALAPFERRELHVDVSRPVAVVLVTVGASRTLARADGAKLALGDRGDGFRVVGLVEHAGKVQLFEDPGALAEAERERYDAVVLVPRDRREGPWEASVAVELGRRLTRRNDPANGKCVDASGPGAALPEWSLFSLPARCGDGVRQDDEDCDDGNRTGGDGCDAYCFKER
jgi:cysteine-rich repeat protein